MKRLKKGISMLCILALLLTIFPVEAFAASKITLKSGSPAPNTVYVDHAYTLKVAGTTVKFTSSDKSVATIGAFTGKMKVVAPGTVKITAKSKQTGKTIATKTFKVLQRSTSVDIEKGEDIVINGVEGTATVTAKKTPATSTDILTFISGDKQIATVGSTSGKITGKAVGTVDVTVYSKATKASNTKAKYNKTDTIRVTVIDKAPEGAWPVTIPEGSKAVIFNTNGALKGGEPIVIPAQIVKAGEKATAPTTPIADNMLFLGWYTAKDPTTGEATGELWDFDSKTVDRVTQLYAKWKSTDTRTIQQIYYDENGKIIDTQKVTVPLKAKISSYIKDVVREGYKLNGWYSDAACTTSVDTNQAIEKDLVIYAKWTPAKPNDLTQIWLDDTGKTVKTQVTSVPYGALAKNYLKEAKLEGFEQDGWYKDKACTVEIPTDYKIIEKQILYAQFVEEGTEEDEDLSDEDVEKEEPSSSGGSKTPVRHDYTVTFDINGHGTAPTAQTVREGNTASEPVVLTEQGYSFGGWYKDAAYTQAWNFTSDTVNGAVTLYAKWTANKYTINFEPNGGSTVADITQDYGSAVTKPADPTKTGNTFAGWYSDAELTKAYTFTTMPLDGIKLYAKWTVATYTVSFDSKGGSAVTEANVEYGKTVAKPADPTKTGNTFAGWYKDAELETAWNFATDTVTKATTLYAKWTTTHMVKFPPLDDLLSISPTEPITGESDSYYLAGKVEHGQDYTFSITPHEQGPIAAAIPYIGGDKITQNADESFTIKEVNEDKTVTFEMKVSQGDFDIVNYLMPLDGIMKLELYDSSMNMESITIETDKTLELSTGRVTLADDQELVIDGTLIIKADTTFNNNGVITVKSGGTLIVKGTLNNKGLITLNDDATLDITEGIINSTISFEPNGGSNVDPITQGYGTAVIAPEDPTKTGNTFAGWYLNGGSDKYFFEVMPLNGITLTARWTVDTYAVTLESNGGIINRNDVTSYTYGIGATLPTASDITLTGHTFDGWYSTGDFSGEPVTQIDATATGDKNYYAKWTANSYNVTLITNGGTIDDGSNVTGYTYGMGATLPNEMVFKYTGHKFGGWYENENFSGDPVSQIDDTATGDKQYYAQWTADTYTVRLEPNQGSIANGKDVTEYTYGIGATLPTASDITLTGHTFDGWYSTGDFSGEPVTRIDATATGDKDYFAKWTANSYNVALITNGGTIDDGSNVTGYTYGRGELLPNEMVFKYTGHKFGGWYENENFSGEQVSQIDDTATGDKQYYAKWTADTYEITLESNGGNANGSATATYNSDALTNLSHATKAQATLNGYFDASAGGSKVIDANGNLVANANGWTDANGKWIKLEPDTLFAQWTANGYSVTLNTKNGTINSNNVTGYDYGTGATLPTADDITLTGHSFDGWFENEGCTGTPITTISATETGDKVYYAKWTVKQYILSYDSKGGSELQSIPLNYGTSLAEYLERPADSPDGQEFDGWYDQSLTTNYTESSTMPADDLTLYAKWVDICKIVFAYGAHFLSIEDPVAWEDIDTERWSICNTYEGKTLEFSLDSATDGDGKAYITDISAYNDNNKVEVQVTKDANGKTFHFVIPQVAIDDASAKSTYLYMDVAANSSILTLDELVKHPGIRNIDFSADGTTMDENLTIASGKTLTLSSGNLTVPSGKTLTVNGDLIIKSGATLTIESGATVTVNKENGLTLENGSTLSNNGTIDGSAINKINDMRQIQ